MNRRIVLLFVGAVVLLIASAGIIFARLRPTSGPADRPNQPTVSVVATGAVTPGSPTLTAIPSLTSAPAATARTTATRVGTPLSPPATTTRSRASATPALPTVANGNCTMSLPSGYGIEPSQAGYYPANDHTGFVALDSFVNGGGGQTPEALAQSFASGTLNRVLTDYRQLAAVNLGDRYRIDFSATANGQPGRGSVYVQTFGTTGCGATIFALDTATGALATTLEVLVGSLGPLPLPRPGTATPVR